MLFLAASLASCRKDADRPGSPAVAYLMVYNGSPDFYGASSMVLINNSYKGDRSYNDNGGGLVGAFNFSRYSFVDTGVYQVAFTDTARQAEQVHKLTQLKVEFEDGKHYTMYFMDSLGYYEMMTTMDDVAADPLQAKIRLVDLSPDAGTVHLRIDTMAIDAIKNVSYRTVTGYTSVKPDVKPGIRIMYTEAGTGTERTLIRKSFPLEAGKCYTMILRGYKAPSDGNVNKTINLSTITNF
jgi:hypothetical protein